MRWVILALWIIMTIINIATGGIGSRDIYIAGTIMLAAEYVAEEAKSDK